MNNQSTIYISKNCPHSRKLLMMLQKIPELKGSIQVSAIEDSPYPNVIKSVPSMISNGELWNADELFQVLSQKLGNQQQQMPQQQQQQQMPQQQQQMPQQHQQMPQQHQQMPHQQQQQQQPSENNDVMFDGYMTNGSDLSYAPLDGNDKSITEGMYQSIGGMDGGSQMDISREGHSLNNKKTEQFDNDYERMMKERGEIMPNRPR